MEDAREYDDFNMQVDEEVAMYTGDEMMETEDNGSEAVGQCSSANDATDVVCGSGQKSRKKECPGHKRRIVTVTQWDASARRQMIQQLGQRGVT